VEVIVKTIKLPPVVVKNGKFIIPDIGPHWAKSKKQIRGKRGVK
jgi:hypothetical protein